MPEWKDMTIILSSKPYGETGMLVSVLSPDDISKLIFVRQFS